MPIPIKKQVHCLKPFVIWFTGLPCSGKTTLANNLQSYLLKNQLPVCVLDGDSIRRGLNSDLDFSREGRKENIRRIGEVVRILIDAENIPIVSTISPFREDRSNLRKTFEPGQFLECYLDCPKEECAKRDVKGHYKLAKKGKLLNFTGVSAEYEPPINPEINIKTHIHGIQECTDQIVRFLVKNNFIFVENLD